MHRGSIKQSENGNDVIVRSYETEGHESKATLDLGFAGVKWFGTFRPFEIKTLRIGCATHNVTEVNALEQ